MSRVDAVSASDCGTLILLIKGYYHVMCRAHKEQRHVGPQKMHGLNIGASCIKRLSLFFSCKSKFFSHTLL